MRKVRDTNNVTVDILFNSTLLLVVIKVPVKWVEDDEPRLDSTITRIYIRNALTLVLTLNQQIVT